MDNDCNQWGISKITGLPCIQIGSSDTGLEELGGGGGLMVDPVGGDMYTKLKDAMGWIFGRQMQQEMQQRPQQQMRAQIPQPQRQRTQRFQPKSIAEASTMIEPPVLPSRHEIPFLKNRIANEKKVADALFEIKSKERQWGLCMTGMNNLRQNVSDVSQIGRGAYGTAYKVKVKGSTIVVKEAELFDNAKMGLFDKTNAVTNTDFNRIDARVSELAYPKEYKLLAMTRNLIKMDASPNFAFAYDIGFCNQCLLQRNDQTKEYSLCSMTFMELADGDLYRTRFTSSDEAYSVLFQLLLALQSMETTYGIMHNDTKSDNILVKRIQPGGYFKYTIENSLVNETFYVKNMGIIPMISDFGLSKSFHPQYSNNNGTRLAKIEKPDFRLEPLMDRKYTNTITWTDGQVSTFNMVTKNTDLSAFTTRWDPSDFVNYPAFEFFIDVMDMLHMFSGGARMSYVGAPNHRGLQGTPRSMVEKINILDSVLKSKIVKGVHNGPDVRVQVPTYDKKMFAKYISPVLMLKELYYDNRPNDYYTVASFRST